MKKTTELLPALFLILVIFCGCLAAQVAGDVARSGQKETDVVLARGITPAMLQEKRNIAVNINGVNTSGQYVFSVGDGNTNAGVYSDMLTKEFLKMGYQSRTITDNISESSGQEAFRELVERGFDIVLIGNMNISMTTSVTGALTGGDYAKTGVTSFTVKGIDVENGNILFILSTEYGKAKKASEVTQDLAELYRDLVLGRATATQVDTNDGSSSQPFEEHSSLPESEAPQDVDESVIPAGLERDTRWIQESLNELGYDCGSADGIMGPKTQRCIEAFQRDNSLEATGKADRTTAERIYTSLRER